MTFTAPQQISKNYKTKSIFLGGTIDMGNSINWQENFIELFFNRSYLMPFFTADFYNPRRKNWDSSWHQTFDNPHFFQQVMWELDAIDKADYVVINFLKDSKSPISFLEMGMLIHSNKLVVCCPDGFYRSGNINIVCNKYSIPIFKHIEEVISWIQSRIQ